jgi:predicted metal-binding membrane protein
MPGGWDMGMMWTGMPNRGRIGDASSFLSMWMVMMTAMMLPALVPALLRYRLRLLGVQRARVDLLTAIAAVGYFFVWALLGVAVFPAGVLVASAARASVGLARFLPVMTASVVMVAGMLQLTQWNARELDRCRESLNRGQPTDGPRSAWRFGVRLGANCASCCGGLMAVLLVTGLMNLCSMALIALALTVVAGGALPSVCGRSRARQ